MEKKGNLVACVTHALWRSQPIRDAFRIGKIEFTDNRMSYPQYGEFKAAGKAPTGVPVLEIDGKLIGQSNAILAFAGKKAKLYPTDDLEALQVDEVLAAVEDLIASMAHTFYMPERREGRRPSGKSCLPTTARRRATSSTLKRKSRRRAARTPSQAS